MPDDAMDDEMRWRQLARYVTGECAPEEIAEVEQWIAGDPARDAVMAEMRTIWANADVAPSGWDPEGAWRVLEPRLGGAAPVRLRLAKRAPNAELRVGPRRSAQSLGLRVAAAIALVVGAGILATRLRQPASEPAADAPIAMREYVTPRGQRADFNLPDGTHVVLSVASRLRVPTDYGANARDAYLEGEAYFEVTHDERRPFAVHAGSAVARDLGTRFSVRAYEGENRVQVVVAEGEVGLRATAALADERRLIAGQLGRVAAGGAVTVRSGVDLDRYLAWTDGRLVFDNTPLREALPQLGRWYDLDFRLGDSALGSLPLTATLKNQPTADVLELLALTLGVRQERRGGTVTFYRTGPPR